VDAGSLSGGLEGPYRKPAKCGNLKRKGRGVWAVKNQTKATLKYSQGGEKKNPSAWSKENHDSTKKCDGRESLLKGKRTVAGKDVRRCRQADDPKKVEENVSRQRSGRQQGGCKENLRKIAKKTIRAKWEIE